VIAACNLPAGPSRLAAPRGNPYASFP
jgi:hypothetical protein